MEQYGRRRDKHHNQQGRLLVLLKTGQGKDRVVVLWPALWTLQICGTLQPPLGDIRAEVSPRYGDGVRS